MERHGQAEGMSKIAGQRDTLVALSQCAVRIAKEPRNDARCGFGKDPGVDPVDEGMGAVGLRVVHMDCLLEVVPSRNEVSHPKEGHSTGTMCLDEEGPILGSFA